MKLLEGCMKYRKDIQHPVKTNDCKSSSSFEKVGNTASAK